MYLPSLYLPNLYLMVIFSGQIGMLCPETSFIFAYSQKALTMMASFMDKSSSQASPIAISGEANSVSGLAVSASIALISSADETPISLGQPNSGIAEIEAIENGFITIDDRLLNQADDDIDSDLDAIGIGLSVDQEFDEGADGGDSL